MANQPVPAADTVPSRCPACGSWVRSLIDTRHAVCSDVWHATETWCPATHEVEHCGHWFDCDPCCRCGFDGGGEDCDCPRHNPLYFDGTGEVS